MRAVRGLTIALPLLASCVGIVESDHKTSTTASASSGDVTVTGTTDTTGSTDSTTNASTANAGPGSAVGSGGATVIGTGSSSSAATSGAGGGDVQDAGPSGGSGGAGASGGSVASGGSGGTRGGGGQVGAGGAIADASVRDAAIGAPDVVQGDPEPGALKGITSAHNAARAAVGVPPLTWDPAIAATAQAYAAQCVFVHSMAPGLGENLSAFAPPGGRTASAPVNGWVAENVDYNYATNTCAAGKVCGHYTQVVWKNSLRVGCGVQSCSTNSPFMGFPNWEIWVCNYAPQGNIIGQKPY